MKRFLHLPFVFVVGLCLVIAPTSFTGCAGPKTREAVVFNTFQSTYRAARTAYEGYLELVVEGFVRKEQEARADALWNDFRAAFTIAFQAASNDWSASTPEATQKIADNFIKLVRSL